jgi:LytS/YehU family sensor histidine kinase
VENAIQHGIGRRVEGGELRVAAERTGAALTIRIGNDGPPLATGWQPGVGVGNSRARLANLYGDASGISVHNCNGGVEAVLTMPYTIAPQ